MKKGILFLLVLLTISSVSAITFSENVSKSAIIPELNQPAKVELSISDFKTGEFNVYTLTDVRIEPEKSFKLVSPEDKINLLVYPTDSLKTEGYYSFTYYLREESSKQNYEDKMVVNVVPLKDALEITSEANYPNDDKVRFFVRNKVNADLKNLKVNFSSGLFDLNNQNFDLDAYSIKIFDVSVPDLKKFEAGSYLVSGVVEVVKGSGEIGGKIYIGEKQGIETEEESSGFIIRTEKVLKSNVGNVFEEVNVVVEKDAFSRLFTNFNLEPNVVDRAGWKVSYIWNKRLGPSEELEVVSKTNYIFPLFVFIAAGFLVLGFKRFYTKKVEVIKSVSPIKTKGGQFALRVKISVKAKKDVQNVSLVDKIPAVVKIHEKFETLKPDKVDLKNRRIEWNFGDLNSGEERSISYIVYSAVGVVGRFALPSAVVVFENESEIHEVESNHVYFLSEQVIE